MKKPEKTLTEIEQTQEKLRESIEAAKELAEKSEKLLKQHRREIETNDAKKLEK